VSESIFQYFPQLSGNQIEKLSLLKPVYERWNRMINVISRKDMDQFMVHHVLHSMAIARVITFVPDSRILDVGTGGGFPGIPLAIMFPESEFSLLDSIEKKIGVVKSVISELELKNVKPLRKRVEDEKGKYHFVVSRAVTEFPRFVKLTSKNIDKAGISGLRNGILYLKGGDIAVETARFGDKLMFRNIKDFFHEPFFETKKLLYLTF